MVKTTTVAFISDHRMMRDLLGLAIDREEGLVLVGTAATAAEGVRLVGEIRPDVVLLDHVLPDCDGVVLAAALYEQHPGSRLVLMADAWNSDLVHRAARSGASGLVARSSALDGVLDVLRSVRPGSVIVDRGILLLLTAAEADSVAPSSARGRPLLTPREHEVLRRLSQGMDLRAIARELSISLNTCRGYLKSTLSKLHAHSQLEAVLTARRLGLVPDPGPYGVAGAPGDPARLDVG